MLFLWCLLPFLVLMVLVGNRRVNEEEDSGHSHSDPMNEGEESGERGDFEADGGGLSQKLRRVKVVEPLSLYAHMVVIQINLIAVHTPT